MPITLLEVNTKSMEDAKVAIYNLVNSRGFVLTGPLDLNPAINYPSKNKKKEFQRSLCWVIEHATMKRVAMFLRRYSQLAGIDTIKIDYSPKEKAIQESRKAYLKARKEAIEAQARYKEEKGDFYKSAHLG